MRRMVKGALATAVAVLIVAASSAVAFAEGPGAYAHKSSHGPGSGDPDRDGTVVSVEQGPFGPVLVVGGPGAGYVPADPTANPATPAGYNYPSGSSLYILSSDPTTDGHGPYQPACGVSVVAPQGFVCTSTPSANTGEWPALTTVGRPVAGPGVSPWLLGTVYRADLSSLQVTYAGHPLYLFDPGPDSFAGQGFLESVAPLPPWGGLWSLISPSGLVAPGTANLEVDAPAPGQTTYASSVVGVEEYPYSAFIGLPPGGVSVTVYGFSRDSRWESQCSGACTLTWIPVLTTAAPTSTAGLDPRAVGTIVRPGGSRQVTYHGHPLYIFGQEQAVVGPSGPSTTGTAGNGNGVHAFGGTFSVVTP